MSLYQSEAVKQRILREATVAVIQDLEATHTQGRVPTRQELYDMIYHRVDQSLTTIEAEVALGICPEYDPQETIPTEPIQAVKPEQERPHDH